MPEPEPIASDSAGVARLTALAAVWQTIALYHPSVVARGVAWDSALVRAIPAIRAARDTSQLADAYTALLTELRDGATRIELDESTRTPRTGIVSAEWRPDSVLVLRLSADASLDSADVTTMTAAAARIPARVIIDLRGSSTRRDDDATRLNAFVERTGLARALTTVSVASPAERVRRVGGVLTDVHDGAPPRFGGAWMRTDVAPLRGTAATAHRVMVIANAQSVVPREIGALVSAGRATLIADGSIDDGSLVSGVRLPIGLGLSVHARTGELVHPDGTFGLVADTVLQRTTADSIAVRTALALWRANRVPRALHVPGVARAPAVLPLAMDTAAYPVMGARILAGFRVWSAMRSRHAHRDQYDEDADAVFTRVLPRLEAATNSAQFVTAIADLATSLDDAESTLTGPWRETLLGTSSAPFRARLVEGRAIITEVVRDSVTKALGLAIGTEITAADGFPMPAWIAERRRQSAASNEWTRNRDLMRVLPLGAEGDAAFKVRDATGRERSIQIPRRASYAALLPAVERPDAAPVRRLVAGVAYLDVERLTAGHVDSAFAAFADERALVLDLRGTLRASERLVPTLTRMLTHVAMQPRFMARREVSRVASTPCLAATLRESASQCTDERGDRAVWMTVDTTGHFRGRVYALIDERTQGAMERLALALEGSTNVVFVGSASAGAAAVPVPLELPGWLTLGIPADEVRHADGGQVHRVGISPAVDLRPTVRAIREGRDDVLERAQQTIMQQLELPVRRRR